MRITPRTAPRVSVPLSSKHHHCRSLHAVVVSPSANSIQGFASIAAKGEPNPSCIHTFILVDQLVVSKTHLYLLSDLAALREGSFK